MSLNSSTVLRVTIGLKASNRFYFEGLSNYYNIISNRQEINYYDEDR